jgi:hypothetical protein
MKTVIVVAVALAFAGKALADVNYNLAKDQAKRAVTESENASQGIAPQSPPTDPALAATLQNIADLRADLDALNQAADAQAGADQRVSLLNHLSTAGVQGKKASSASVKQLAGHLIAAASGRGKMTAQNPKLARDIHALFNGAHLSTTQQQTLLDAVKKILTDVGTPPDDADNVVSDLKQITAETQ